MWDSLVAGFVNWVNEGGEPRHLALSGKCWPRFVAGGGCDKHFCRELFGGIEVCGNGPCRGRTVHTPKFPGP